MNPRNRVEQMPVDVFGNDDGFVLVADLPGVRVEDLTVELDKGLLTVAGLRRLGLDGENPDTPTFEYRRRFQVPDEIDGERVAARLEHGVLTVTLPRAEAHKPRRIPIS
ncbi:MAG: Hsp20/alpha crystallin family protein [bacterium]